MQMIGIVFLVIGIVCAVSAGIAGIVMLLVNWLLPVFGIVFHITFFQTWAVLFLLGLIGNYFRSNVKVKVGR